VGPIIHRSLRYTILDNLDCCYETVVSVGLGAGGGRPRVSVTRTASAAAVATTASAGERERSGQLPRMGQQRDAEHRERQPRNDRAPE
jgi:hypothetical protein